MAKPVFKRKKDKDGLVTLQVDGDVHAQHAKEFKKELSTFLSHPENLQIRLDGVTMLDVTAVQLLYTLKKAMKSSGHEVKISFPADQGVRGLLEKSGFTKIL